MIDSQIVSAENALLNEVIEEEESQHVSADEKNSNQENSLEMETFDVIGND